MRLYYVLYLPCGFSIPQDRVGTPYLKGRREKGRKRGRKNRKEGKEKRKVKGYNYKSKYLIYILRLLFFHVNHLPFTEYLKIIDDTDKNCKVI
jgi:hypothetical protein